MAKKTSIWVILLNAAIFIALEIAALAMLKHSDEAQGTWISKGVDGVHATVWGSAERVRGYFGLRRQNDSLANENFRLHQQLLRYSLEEKAAAEEDVRIVGSFHYTPATIVRHSNNSQHNFLILDKGSLDDVIAGSGVVTSKGVIGSIDAVSEHYAHVISFRNTESVVSARIGREGPVGPMRWDGISASGAILSEIPFLEELQPGDTVYTSGFSELYPADIPLGITGKSKIVNGATLSIKVSLFEDISRVRYVTITANNDKVEIERLSSDNNNDKENEDK